jgi:hypothetical protein
MHGKRDTRYAHALQQQQELRPLIGIIDIKVQPHFTQQTEPVGNAGEAGPLSDEQRNCLDGRNRKPRLHSSKCTEGHTLNLPSQWIS